MQEKMIKCVLQGSAALGAASYVQIWVGRQLRRDVFQYFILCLQESTESKPSLQNAIFVHKQLC